MKLRRILAALLALLVISLPISACAETTLTSSYTMEMYSLSVARYHNVMIGRDNTNGYYELYAPDGTAITTGNYLDMNEKGQMFKVADQAGLNVYGLIDAEGNQVVPMQYGDVEYISDRWTMGVSLGEATVDNYDYKAWDGSAFYLITGYDVYFDGAKVGTLARTAYGSSYAYGAYLCVRDAEGSYTFYDGSMAPSAYVPDFESNSEYEEKNNEIWHRGSNQQAFCSGCTLTSDDVALDVYVVDGRIVDLQGNVLASVDAKYEYIEKFKGDYARVKMNGKYGLIDRTGVEILACEYDELYCDTEYFEGIYQPVVKDGKFGYVNKNGEVTCDFVYSESAVNSIYRAPVTTVSDLTGEQIVLSGAVGELPEKYAEVEVNSQNGSPLLVVMDAAGQVSVIDMYGNVVIEPDSAYDDTYDLSVSKDGVVVVGYQGSRAYKVYTFAHDGAAVAEETAETGAISIQKVTGAEQTETAEEPAAEETATEETAEDGTWTCDCGSVNSGKFCPECGAAKPAGCPNCGAAAAEGAKFCSECGTALTTD